MKPKLVTAEMLRAEGACARQVELFARTWPEWEDSDACGCQACGFFGCVADFKLE